MHLPWIVQGYIVSQGNKDGESNRRRKKSQGKEILAKREGNRPNEKSDF